MTTKHKSSKSTIITELAKTTKVSAENVETVLNALGIDKTLEEALNHSNEEIGLKQARFAVRLSKNTVSV